jgi:hypothetical protein
MNGHVHAPAALLTGRAILSTGEEGGCIMYWWHISEKIVINFKMNLFNILEYLIV